MRLLAILSILALSATPAPAQDDEAAALPPPGLAELDLGAAVGDVALVGDTGLAVGDAAGRVQLFASEADELAAEPTRVLPAHAAPVYAVAAGPAARWLAVSHLDGHVRLFDLTAKDEDEPAAVFTTGRLVARDLAFSPDGRWLAFSAADGVLRRYDLGAREEASGLVHPDGPTILAVAFAPAPARLVATAATDRRVRTWDAETGALVATLEGHSGWASSVAFDPEAEHLVSAGWDNTLRLWSLGEGVEQGRVAGPEGAGTQHVSELGPLAFVENGNAVAASGTDGTVRLYGVPDLTERRSWQAHPERVTAMVASADGTRLVTGGRDGRLRLWDVTGR